MNSFAIRSAFDAAMIAGTTAATMGASSAFAAEEHPDFLWAPQASEPAAPAGHRLYVGNLSWGSESSAISVYLNPKEISLNKQVPWD